MNKKRLIDIIAMLCGAVCLVSGLMLHVNVHHLMVYDNTALWAIHEAAGLVLSVAVALHCVQHKVWFKNYRKIAVKRKRVSTILLAIVGIVFVTGMILMSGSSYEVISEIHLAAGILFVILAAGHVAKRWKLFAIMWR